MSKENIFDLSKIAAPSNDVEAENISESEQESLLKGYTPVMLSEWKYIPIGSNIRYMRKDGAFRKGGIVRSITENTDRNGNNYVKIDISAGLTTKIWSITTNTAAKVWMKEGQIIKKSFDADLREELDLCKEEIKQQTKQIQKINSELMRIVNLIKNLHKLK